MPETVTTPPDNESERRKLAAEIAKLEAEKRKIENEDDRAERLHRLDMAKLHAVESAARRWYLNPAFLGFLAPVIAALFAFGPQIASFKAVYDKTRIEEETKLLEKKQAFQREINDSIQASNATLLAQQKSLGETNRAILAEFERQKLENSLLLTNLTALTNQIATSKTELQGVQSEKSNLLVMVQELRIESRSKELKLAEKDRLHAIDLLTNHLSDLEREYEFSMVDWNKKPADIANLLKTQWRTNITDYLVNQVLDPKSSWKVRTRFTVTFILYCEDDSNPRWKRDLLDLVRNGQTSRFMSSVNFEYFGSKVTNRLGYWHAEDTHEAWSAYFQSLCNSAEGSETRTNILDAFDSLLSFRRALEPQELQRLATNSCDARGIFHRRALVELDRIGQAYFGFWPGFAFHRLSDPVLLAVMSAKKLAALPAPVNMDTLPAEYSGYRPVAEVLGHAGYFTRDPQWQKKMLQLGLPAATSAGSERNPILDPRAWKEWVLNTNNAPLIDAALSTNLGTWEALIARRTVVAE